MKKNLELKLKINSLSLIENLIKSKRIEHIGEFFQEDIYFDFKNGLLKLRIEENEKSLIFYQRNEMTKDRWSNYSILKLTDNKYEKFLSKSYKELIRVRKNRKLYIYKSTRIHLDLVENLGEFIELETVVNENDEVAKNEFDEVVEMLELEIANQIKDSYKNLLLRKDDYK